jgi:enoyl-[acyl-carrier-protein] reductase (NADH)
MHQIIPLQRAGKKIDIANSCLYIASEAASYITGTTIIVDGGVVLTSPNMAFLSADFVKGYPSMGKSKL